MSEEWSNGARAEQAEDADADRQGSGGVVAGGAGGSPRPGGVGVGRDPQGAGKVRGEAPELIDAWTSLTFDRHLADSDEVTVDVDQLDLVLSAAMREIQRSRGDEARPAACASCRFIGLEVCDSICTEQEPAPAQGEASRLKVSDLLQHVHGEPWENTSAENAFAAVCEAIHWSHVPLDDPSAVIDWVTKLQGTLERSLSEDAMEGGEMQQRVAAAWDEGHRHPGYDPACSENPYRQEK